MDLDKGDFKLLVYGAVLILFLGVNLIRWIANRARGGKPGEPPPPEPEAQEPPSGGPQLPYEDLVDQVFGPYIRQRRREHEQAKKAQERAEAVEVIEVIEEAPPPPPAAPPEEAKPAPPIAVAVAAPPVPAPVRLSLDERIFRNPRWGAAAKLVVAGEILRRPRFPRRPGR